MTEFTIHTSETAPEKSRQMLEGTQKAFGFVPNLMATMAEAPALLEGYATLSRIFDKSDLSHTEKQIILMTNNRLNGCSYCMAAHSTTARGKGVPEDAIETLRAGTAFEDPKLEALRRFTIVVNETRGWPSESDVETFLAAGYTRQTVLEVILGTGLKVLSNYTNHVADTPVDDAFSARVWHAPEGETAA